MILLDTDILTLYLLGQSRVMERSRAAAEPAATSIVSRIVVLQGRFASVLKASDGQQLLAAQQRLAALERALQGFAIVPFDDAAAATFDRLRRDKKATKIGRADFLIASIALANRATLVTRNLRHFGLIVGLQLENWAD